MQDSEDDVTLQVGVQLSHEDVFTSIYKGNLWRDAESVSGDGSSLKATEQLRADLRNLFKTMNIRSIADVPCGDFNWFKAINYEFDYYVGYDIVKELVDENTKRYGSSTIQFRCANIIETNFDPVDLILCRDFVIHCSNKDIFAFFANLRLSSISRILLSQYSNCRNRDIATGNRYRPIDFKQDPFNLPEPEVLIVENIGHMFDTAKCHTHGPQKPLEKYLGCWKTSDIYAALDNNIHYKHYVCSRQTQ